MASAYYKLYNNENQAIDLQNLEGLEATYNIQNEIVLFQPNNPSKARQKNYLFKEKVVDTYYSDLVDVSKRLVPHVREELMPILVESALDGSSNLGKLLHQQAVKKKNNKRKHIKNRAIDGFTLSRRAKEKIRNTLTYLYHKCEGNSNKLRWITITVPDQNRLFEPVYFDSSDAKNKYFDNYFVKLLSKWLENLRQNHNVKNYIWIAERQDGKRNQNTSATGNIHFHMVLELDGVEFIDYQLLNYSWVNHLYDAGFDVLSNSKIHDLRLSNIKKYLEVKKQEIAPSGKFKNPLRYFQTLKACLAENKALANLKKSRKADVVRNAFEISKQSFIHKIIIQPVQCTEIHSLKGLRYYMTKYVTKNSECIYARMWAQTREYSRLKLKIKIDVETIKELQQKDLIESINAVEVQIKIPISKTSVNYDTGEINDLSTERTITKTLYYIRLKDEAFNYFFHERTAMMGLSCTLPPPLSTKLNHCNFVTES